MFMSWGERTLDPVRYVQEGLCNFFKYEQYDVHPIKDLLKTRSSFEEAYLKAKHSLINRKEKSFSSADYVRWEIPNQKLQEVDKAELTKNKTMAFDLMFSKDTVRIEELKETFAYYDKKTFTEIINNLEAKNRLYAKNFIMFTKMQSENLTSEHITFADCLSHFKESGGIKQLKNSGSILVRERSKILLNEIPADIEHE